jgi:hypothetical protein
MKKLILVVSIMLLAFLSLAQYCFGQVEPLQVYNFRLRKQNIDTRGFSEGCQLIQEVIFVYLHDQNQHMQLFIEQYDDASKCIRITINDWQLYTWNVQSSSWVYICTLTKYRWYKIVASYNGATKDYYVDVHYFLSKDRIVNQLHWTNYNPLNCHYMFNFEFFFNDAQTYYGMCIDHIKFESMSNLGRWVTNWDESFGDLDFSDWTLYYKDSSTNIESVKWYYQNYDELVYDNVLRIYYVSAYSRNTWADPSFDLGYTKWSNVMYPYLDVPPSQGTIANGMFQMYAYEGQGDEWGDCLTAQGKKPHSAQYYNNLALTQEWFIPADVVLGEYTLITYVKQDAVPTYLADPVFGKAPCTTAGVCVFLIFEIQYERGDGSIGWVPWEDPDVWGLPNNIHIEDFMTRWIWNSAESRWQEVSYFPPYHCWTDITSHDSDFHLILNLRTIGSIGTWKIFTTDISDWVKYAMYKAWFGYDMTNWDPNFYRVSGLKLRTVNVATEVIGCDFRTAVTFTQLVRKF